MSWAMDARNVTRGVESAQAAPIERPHAIPDRYFALNCCFANDVSRKPRFASWEGFATRIDGLVGDTADEPRQTAEVRARMTASAPAQTGAAAQGSALLQRVATARPAVIRTEPEMAAAVARTVPAKVIMVVFQRKDDWLEVGSSYAWGWVHSSFVYPYDPSSGAGSS